MGAAERRARALWERTQAAADREVRASVRRALASTRQAEIELERTRRAMVVELRRLARRSLGLASQDPLPRSSEREIARTVDRATSATRAVRTRAMIRAVAESLRAASSADAAIAALVNGPRVTVLGERAAMTLAARLTHNTALTVGGIPLSRRVHAVDAATRSAMSASVQDSLRAGRSVRASAERLLLVEDRALSVHLPRYVTELRDAVRTGATSDELRALVRTHARAVSRLVDSPNGLRQSARAFMTSAPEATAADIDRAIQHFIFDKARYLEQRIVRTEGQRALAEAFVASTREREWTMGYRWNLSGGHPREDICDVYAGSDTEGLGEGGYSEAALPECPAHPHCLCFVSSIVDDQHEQRLDARSRGAAEPPRAWESGRRESPADWLARQSADTRRRILGPGRDDLFDTHPERVISSRGQLRPLWQAEGRGRPPAPSLGERARLAPESRMRAELRAHQDDALQQQRDARLDAIARAL